MPLVSSASTNGFHEDSVAHVFRYHSDEDIQQLVDMFADWQQQLDEEFNMDLVIFPVPNKFTVYQGTVAVGVPYDNFLERLATGLDDVDVPVVRTLDALQASSELTYWPNDTHWNQAGIDIAATALAATVLTTGQAAQ